MSIPTASVSPIKVDIQDFGRHTFSPPISTPVAPPNLPAVPNPARIVKITDAHLFGAMARGIGLRADPAAYALHIDAVKMLFGRHLNFTAGSLNLDFAGYTGLPLIDFMQRGFTGLVGYGLSTLAANNDGYIWHTHYEEAKMLAAPVGGDFIQHHNPWDKIHGKKSPKPRSKDRRPDLISLKSDITLGIIECKGTLSHPLNKFWRSTIFEAFMEQSEPFLGASVAGLTVDEVAVYCGQLSKARASGFICMNSTLPTAGSKNKNASGILRPIVLPSYRRWLRLMGSGFWTVGQALHRKLDVNPPLVRLAPSPIPQANLSFIIDENLDGGTEYVLGMLESTYNVLSDVGRYDIPVTLGFDFESSEDEYIWNFSSEEQASQKLFSDIKDSIGLTELSDEFSNSTGGALFSDGTVVVKREYIESVKTAIRR